MSRLISYLYLITKISNPVGQLIKSLGQLTDNQFAREFECSELLIDLLVQEYGILLINPQHGLLPVTLHLWSNDDDDENNDDDNDDGNLWMQWWCLMMIVYGDDLSID